MSEVMSQDAGINADVGDVNTQDVQDNVQDTQDTWEDTASKKGKSGVPKLLAEKNAAIKRAEELEAKLAEVQNQTLDETQLEQALGRINERKEVISNLDEEQMIEYNKTASDNPNLSPKQIAKLIGADLEPKNPRLTSMPWQTPSQLRQKQTLQDKDDATITQGAEQELREMLGY